MRRTYTHTVLRRHPSGEGRAAGGGLRSHAAPGCGDAPGASLDRSNDGCPADWDPATARLVPDAAPRVAPPVLTLPLLSPEIPQVLHLRRPAYGLPELAEAMLAEGMLKETDWNGDVRESLKAGLQRWIDQTLGGEPLRRVYLGIVYANTLTMGAGMEPTLWLRARPGRNPHEPIGTLSVIGSPQEGPYDESRDVYVGRSVLALEEHRAGLGYQVLGLLQDVLGPVLHVGGPGQGYHHLGAFEAMHEKWRELTAQPGGPALSFDSTLRGAGIHMPLHGLTLADYLREIPEAACVCPKKLRTHLIHEALQRGTAGEFRQLLELARDLDRLRKLSPDTLACDTPLFLDTRFSPAAAMGGALKEAPWCLRWKAGDPIARIVDDFHMQIRMKDAGTNIVWMQAWQASDPEGLRRAVRNWRRVLSVGLKACRLAELLHSEKPHDAQD